MYIHDGQNILNVVVYLVYAFVTKANLLKFKFNETNLNGVHVSKMTNVVTSIEAIIFIKTNQNVNYLIQQSYLDS